MAQMVKNLPERQETPVRSLGWEDPLQKGMASTAAFFSGEAGGCGGGQSGGCRGSDMTEPLSPSGFFPVPLLRGIPVGNADSLLSDGDDVLD